MSRMEDRNRLWDAVRQACSAIEDNGHLRSALRRAACGQDLIGLEAVDAFARRLPGCLGWWRPSEDKLGAMADGAMVLLAQRNVKRSSSTDAALPPRGSVAQLLGERVSGERRRLSELRFQRLLRVDGADERLQQMRRALALLEPPLHPLAVVEAWLDLHSELGRRRFARVYFTGISESDGAAPATPAPDAA